MSEHLLSDILPQSLQFFLGKTGNTGYAGAETADQFRVTPGLDIERARQLKREAAQVLNHGFELNAGGPVFKLLC